MLPRLSNLAIAYEKIGRLEQALQMKRESFYGHLKIIGEEDENTLTAANNYAFTLARLNCQKEAKSVLRRTMPVARRILGENLVWLQMRWCYAKTLCEDPNATLDDLREAVTTLEDTELTARRVLGGTHPVTAGIGEYFQKARPVRDARETPPGSA